MKSSFTDFIDVKILPADNLIDYLKERINILEKENEDKEREKREILSRYPFILNEGEKLISIHISSKTDDNVDFLTICKNTDKFKTIVEKLYRENTELNESNNQFYYKGNKIDNSKSLEDNGIKENAHIYLK